MEDKAVSRYSVSGLVSKLPLVALFGCAWVADRWPNFAFEAILVALAVACGQLALIYSRAASSTSTKIQSAHDDLLGKMVLRSDFSLVTKGRERAGEQDDLRLGYERLTKIALCSAAYNFAAEWSQFSAPRRQYDAVFESHFGKSEELKVISLSMVKDVHFHYSRFLAAAGPLEIESRDGHVVVFVVNESRAKNNLLWGSELERLLEQAQERLNPRVSDGARCFTALSKPLKGYVH